MCSFGGRIEKRPTDSSLCYLGGETRMVKIDRQASLADLRALLSQFFAGGRLISLKYQIPGVHLDSLISIFTEEDLKVFISECDRAENAVVSRSRIPAVRL
ncbi:hypothetical protein QOZ80_4AG0310940 [Eleusine coracana subsp. coracana]|nr:hypothetical protein QOZ80_4AG0310940 [Eleusine coracana subsp. coracana]